MKQPILTCLLIALMIVSCQQNTVIKEEQTIYQPKLVEGRYNVAFLIMDGTFNTEFTAPFDVFQHTIYRDVKKAMNVFTVAATLEPVTTFEGVRILPDFAYTASDLPIIDILVVPSAEHHLDTDLENRELIAFVKKTADNALYVTSHCDGAFVLAKSGILDGVESTTFPGDINKYKQMFPHLKVHDKVFFVHDGKFITSAGGARSFEAALYLTEVLYGKEIPESIAGGLVLDWNLEAVPHIIVEMNN